MRKPFIWTAIGLVLTLLTPYLPAAEKRDIFVLQVEGMV